MINKLYKITHNKYYELFRFIFFLRYLIAIFVVSIALFLTIPFFFNYEKKIDIIKDYLLKNYKLEIENHEKISFHALPYPCLKIKNAIIKVDNISTNLNVKELKLVPKILSIYNFKNFGLKKIVLMDSYISLKISNIFPITNNFFNKKNKILVNNLRIKIIDKNQIILELKNVKFSNFGYDKNFISGKIFEKKFKIKIDDYFKKIDFKLINSGINADIDFDKNSNNKKLSGIFKAKILSSNVKFYFDYNYKILNIFNSYFRSKNLSFKNDSAIILNPFLDINTKVEIEDINNQIFKNFDITTLLGKKDILKKINLKKEIDFKAKKFSKSLIDKLNLKIDVAYGRVNYFKTFSVLDSHFSCEGNINLLEEYPLLFFDCLLVSNDKKKLLNKFSIKSKLKNEILRLTTKGNLNILSGKINLKKVLLNKDYEASKEDLEYFKNSIEKIIFDEGLIGILNNKKIKEFILEVS